MLHKWLWALVVLTGWVLFEGICAWQDGWLTYEQMQAQGIEQGIFFLGHPGMWMDLLVLNLLLATMFARYEHQWKSIEIVVVFILAFALSAGMHYQYAQDPFPTALGHHGLPVAGMLHLVYMAAAFTIVALFYTCTRHSSRAFVLAASAILFAHVIIGVYVPLKIWTPSWFPQHGVLNALTLVALGIFDFWYALGVLAFKDVVMDTAFYATGRLAQVPFLDRQIQKVRSATHLADRVLTSIESGWRRHPMRLMWIGKLAYGLSAWFLVSAGIAGVSFKKFYFYTLPVTLFQFGVLMVLGYFLGTTMWSNIQNWWLIATILLIVVTAIFFGMRMLARRIRQKYVEPKPDPTEAALVAIQEALKNSE